jgi:hypothetical protein
MKMLFFCTVTFVTGGAAPFGPALIEKFMEKVRREGKIRKLT